MEELQGQVERAVSELYGEQIKADLALAPEDTGADYATNVAMRLAKAAKKSSIAIAEELKVKLDSADAEITIAGPGFLNFRMKDEYYAEKVMRIEAGEKMGLDEYAGKTVVAEFSDPNPFKVLHVGHLYTSIVGDSISRLLELAGARVIRANFGGDVGMHVAKTLWALKTELGEGGAFRKFLDHLTIEGIAKAYVEGTQAYEEDEVARAEMTKLNKEIYRINAEKDHGGELAELYWRGRELSYEYFEEFYARVGVRFDKYYPESTVADRGLAEVREHTGTVYEESDGAVVFRGEKMGLHTRVFINREGVPTYEAKDVGLIFTKWDDWRFDESVVITGNEQTEYMKVVLASVKEYAPELVGRTSHLTHGLVKLPGNVKMSSRRGNFLKAVDVLEMVKATLSETSASSRNSGSEKIVLAAIKYAFLRYKMGGDIVFDPKESVSMTGNSGVYLLYSAVRAKKILHKASEGLLSARDADEHDPSKGKGASSYSLDGIKVLQDGKAAANLERTFVRGLEKKLTEYEAILRNAVTEKAPYKICSYLYELAQEFSRFYEHVRVAGNEREKELLMLVRAYLKVMEHGLELLGIEVPEEM